MLEEEVAVLAVELQAQVVPEVVVMVQMVLLMQHQLELQILEEAGAVDQGQTDEQDQQAAAELLSYAYLSTIQQPLAPA
jgi:hypothetical protein